MAGYAATELIRGASPRLVRDPLRERGATDVPEVGAGAAVVETIAVAVDHRRGEAAAPTIRERWLSVRERWAQLTFFLVSPDSWR